jgi:GNAT superfamily N-acetyltransferase
MRDEADTDLLGTWARGWCLVQGVSPPEDVPGGWRIEANRPDGRWRFLYPRLCDAALAQMDMQLPDTVAFKIVAMPERVRAAMAYPWPIAAPAYFMTCESTDALRRDVPPEGYGLTSQAVIPGVTSVEIRTHSGELAASGYLGMVDDLAVFHRIRTQDDHQRRGLGTALMAALGQLADDAGATRRALVATIAGRALYQTIGWQVHAPYTTVTIPASARETAPVQSIPARTV